jgi:Ca-activated chloride channel homolog
VRAARRQAASGLVAALVAALLQAQERAKPLEFKTEVGAVYVDAFVTRGDRPLADLGASAFELLDNGVPQQLELLSAAARPLSAFLVFDTSSSMALGDRLEALRAAGGAFLDGLRPADEASLVAFSEDVIWLAEATADKAAVRRALSGLRAEGATSVFDALYAAILLSAGELRPLVVLFTDGEDNNSWLGEGDLRLVAERSNALVHVVGWRPPRAIGALPLPPRQTESSQEGALREIAEAAGGRYWNADSPKRLRHAFAAIADAVGHRYVLRYEPTGVARAGWHRIDARLRGVKGEVRVRRGYWLAP